MIKVALVEDQPIFRTSLKRAFDWVGGIEVTFETAYGEELRENYNPEIMDVVLLDIRLSGESGIFTLEAMKKKFPDSKIIMMSQYDDYEVIIHTIKKGARAYFAKNYDVPDLVNAMKMVHERGYYFDHNLGEMIVRDMERVHKSQLINNQFRVEFSEQELEIAKYCCKGLSNDEIATLLNVSKRSIENHRTNMTIKTDSKNFYGVIVYLFKHYLLLPGSFQ